MAKSRVQILGDKKLLNLIDQLPTQASKKRIWRGLARKASRPIIESVRSKVPVDQGHLKRSVKYRNFKKIADGKGGFVNFANTDSGTMTNPPKGSILVNNRTPNKNGRLKKTYRNFFAEAADDSGLEALAMMERGAVPLIQREIKRLT